MCVFMRTETSFVGMGTANPTASNLFVATIFLAGALAGMSGLFISQRIHAPPRSMVLRESLKKPLLVCKADQPEGTPLDQPLRAGYTPMAA